MILGMDAPSLAQILRRSRPDVTGTRLASLHYCLSQQFSLRLFRFCRHKRLLYVHPNMRARLRRLGYREEELVFVSNGVEVEKADETPPQEKQFDIMWIGRAHVQKGLEDLLATLQHLAGRFDGFRAVLVGQLQQALGPRVAEMGLTACVHFAGFVSEEEKYRYYKASRVFLMPSRYESWGIVIGEALACNLPVVAYDLEAYRPVFGDLLRYVRPFDAQAFTAEAEAQVRAMREGRNYLSAMDLQSFKTVHSWAATRERIASVLRELSSANKLAVPAGA
jgi:glycosyltransferase involved in cell wall biosynthesis